MARTCTVYTDVFGRFHTACGPAPLVVQPPELAAWYAAYQAGLAGVAAVGLLLGDSMSEGYQATHLRTRWWDQVRRRAQGSQRGNLGLLQPSANLFSSLVDVDWPGGDCPWTVTGAPTPDFQRGFGLHALSVPVGAALGTTWFGDALTLYFTGLPTGATAAVVRVDGVVATTLDARDAVATPGKTGAVLGLTYGHHAVTFEPNDGPLVLEGVVPADGDASVFGYLASVLLLDGTHAGLATGSWADAGAGGNDWSAGLVPTAGTFQLAVVALGRNDQQQAHLPPATFQANLVTVLQRLEARAGHAVPAVLLLLPGVTDPAYVTAAQAAAATVGAGHVVVLDAAGLLPGRVWPAALTDDDVHPNQAGHDWLADLVGRVVVPVPPTAVPTTPDPSTFRAQDPPLARVSWPEQLVDLGGGAFYDQSPGGTTVAERRQGVWLDAGTYTPRVTYHRDAGLGTLELLVGTYQQATPTLASAGSVATAGAAGLVTVTLAPVTTSVPGRVPIYVRKTADAGAVRFVSCELDRT